MCLSAVHVPSVRRRVKGFCPTPQCDSYDCAYAQLHRVLRAESSDVRRQVAGVMAAAGSEALARDLLY